MKLAVHVFVSEPHAGLGVHFQQGIVAGQLGRSRSRFQSGFQPHACQIPMAVLDAVQVDCEVGQGMRGREICAFSSGFGVHGQVVKAVFRQKMMELQGVDGQVGMVGF